MSSGDDKQTHKAVGLSHSNPLVTMPAAPPAVQPALQQSLSAGSPVSAGGDHPLADVPPPAVGTNVELPQRTPSLPPPPMMAPPPNIVVPPHSARAPPPQPIPTTLAPASAPPPQRSASPFNTTSMTLDDMADRFLSEPSPHSKDGFKPVLQPEPLPANATDLERLYSLVQRRAWGDVILMTDRLLRGSSSHYAPIYDSLLKNTGDSLPTLDSQQQELVWIMTIQCHARLKMRRYSDLGLEIELWGFCHHNDNTAPGWIPWSLHILAASTLIYTCEDPTSDDALDALWDLRTDIPDEEAVAKLQVEHAISNAFTRRKDWRMVLSSYQRMLEVLPDACEKHTKDLMGAENSALTKARETAYKCEILSRQGRVFLQLGALKEAAALFEQATATWQVNGVSGASDMDEELKKDDIVTLTSALLSINDGLLSFGYARHGEALDFFRKAVQHIRESGCLFTVPPSIGSSPTLLPCTLGLSPGQTFYSEAVNNMAICALYTCRLQEALHLMESLVREDPTSFLTERVTLNLCTLYELSNETTVSARKKRVLQLIAKRFLLHDIGPNSFRL